MSVLSDIISKDYPLEGTGRWLKPVDTLNHPSSLVVDTEEEVFYYNSRGVVGDAFIWLTKIKGLSPEVAREALKNHKKYTDSHVVTLRDGKEIVVLPRLVDIFWENGKSIARRDYWYRRGLNDIMIDRFRLGYNNDWHTLPIFVDGSFRNFQIRMDKPDKRIKSWYRGVGPLLFNSSILKLSNSVIITEGPIDAMLLTQYGFPAVSHTGGAQGWLPEWGKRFNNQKEIFICYDNDDAGYKGARKLAKVLGEYKCKILDWNYFDSIELKKGYDVVDFFTEGNSKNLFSISLLEGTKRIFE